MNFINKFQKFMYGRYGVDELYKFLFKIYIGLIIIDIFINSKILLFLELLLIFVITYRFLSKNCYQRRKENKTYLRLKDSFEKPFENMKRNINDKDYIYRKCSNCKKTLKLPIPFERGIKHTKCPNCEKRITIFTLKKQKVEIIKNKRKVNI